MPQFFPSQFKCQFVKGMAALGYRRGGREMADLLADVSSGLGLKANEVRVWVEAYLIVIALEKSIKNRAH